MMLVFSVVHLCLAAPPGRGLLRATGGGGATSGLARSLKPMSADQLRKLLSSLRARRQWKDACEALWWAVEEQPDTVQPVHFNLVLASLSASAEWERCLVLLEHDMPRAGVTPDAYSYSPAIAACARSGQPAHAVALFKSMVALGVAPHPITCNTVLSACQRASQPHELLAIFASLRRRPVHTDARAGATSGARWSSGLRGRRPKAWPADQGALRTADGGPERAAASVGVAS